MSTLSGKYFLNGYYDDNGNWQRTKHCFINCGHNCNCHPPGNLHYSKAHDKRINPDPPKENK